MLAKWGNLSSSVATASKIPNLIWTDIAANMMVGTKSDSSYPRQVRISQRRITYKGIFGIPGILCLVLWLAWAILLLGLGFSRQHRRRISFHALKRLINRLSVGRPLADAQEPGIYNLNASTKEWLREPGHIVIDLASEEPEETGFGPNHQSGGGGGWKKSLSHRKKVSGNSRQKSNNPQAEAPLLIGDAYPDAVRQLRVSHI
jgi:hypothetical protein